MDIKILIVDDEMAIVRLCEQILSLASFKVCSASTPAAALDLLAKSKFDLLLVDIRMPLMDGFELSRRAKQIYPGLATLAMTGFGTVDVAIEAMHKGLDGLILKPFESENLVATVKQTLEEKKLKIETTNTLILQPLIEAGHQVIGETDPVGLITRIESCLKELLKAKFVVLYSIKKGGKEFSQINKSDGPFPWELEDLKNFQETTSPHDNKWILPAASGYYPLPIETNMSKLGWGACLIASVIRSSETFLFCIGRDTIDPVFSEQDYSLFVVFARQAVIALINSRLFFQIYGKHTANAVSKISQSNHPKARRVKDISEAYSIPPDFEKIANLVYRFKNGLVIDCEKRLAQRVESLVSLTPNEALILCVLIDKYGLLVSHSEIVRNIQGYDLSNAEAAKIVRPLVSRLREKLLVLGIGPDDLINVRGAGYLFEIEASCN